MDETCLLRLRLESSVTPRSLRWLARENYCECCTPRPRYSISKVTKLKWLYLWNGQTCTKMCNVFLKILLFAIERQHCGCCFHIAWPSFWRSTIFLLCICNKNCAMTADDPGKICFDSNCFRRGAALVYSLIGHVENATLHPDVDATG